MIDPNDHEAQDLAAEARAQREYCNALLRHPDPRDPDFPGPDADEVDDE